MNGKPCDHGIMGWCRPCAFAAANPPVPKPQPKFDVADGHLLYYISEGSYEALVASETEDAPEHEPPRPRTWVEPPLPAKDESVHEPVLKLVSQVGPEKPPTEYGRGVSDE